MPLPISNNWKSCRWASPKWYNERQHVRQAGRVNIFQRFLFWGSASCCAYFIKVIGRTVPPNNHLRCLFIFISPLHVSASLAIFRRNTQLFSGSFHKRLFHIVLARGWGISCVVLLKNLQMSKENLKEREKIRHGSQMGSRHQDRLADWLPVVH
jgi:hypothetical protein